MNRTALGLIVIAATISCGFNGLTEPVQAAQMGPIVDTGFFYDRLAPYGNWWQHPRWGWVWSPRDVPVSWQPYTVGRWVFTDDYGWLWESDEDWGWACYHYGRWGWDSGFGWFWVPGSYWSPAWVSWRTSPGFIGWCPLPPPVRWRPGVGLDFGDFDLDDLPPWQWVFVETRFFDAPRLHDHILLVSRNVILVRETRLIVRFEVVNSVIVNRSFSARFIEEFTRRPVARFRVRHVDNPAAMRVFREREREIAVFSPRVRRGPAGLVPPGPGELERRQNAERAHLQERQHAEQLRQEERLHAERPAPGMSTEPMQRRQEAERQALQGEHQRQQQMLQNRQMRERQGAGGFAGGPGPQQRGFAGGPAPQGGGMRG